MRLIFVELSCLQANFMFKLTPVTSKIGEGHPIFEPNQDTLEIHPWYKIGPNAINICWVIVFTSENWKLSCLNWPRDLKNRSRSSIFELNQDTLEIHPWYKFGPNAINICWVIVFTSEFHVYIDPVTSKIGQGHPSSNLTKTLFRYIHGISLGPMQLIFVELSCLPAKIVMFKLTPVTSKIGQGHPSSNLTKTLLRYIHGISLGPMRLIFVELSCLQVNFMFTLTPWPPK